jgi:hypothetical protein
VAEGAPLLREYVGKTCIEGSNPSGSASKSEPSLVEGFFLSEPRTVRACGQRRILCLAITAQFRA